MASVAALKPGRAEAVRAVSHTLGVLLLGASTLTLTFLFIRDFGIQRLGRTLVAQLRSPVTGASYATIPGSLNVMTLASSLGRSWRRRPGDSGCWPSRPRPALACGCGCACG